MDLLQIIIVISVLYGIIYFFDSFFKTCAHYPYIKFLEGTGLVIKLFHLKWTTKFFNRTLIKLGHNRHWSSWFDLGMYTSLILLPISIILLFIALLQNFFSGSSGSENNIVIEPIMPGVNLPVSELGYYSLTLAICSIVHEIGHALAAVNEDVHLINVGANVMFILPFAFVTIGNDKLSSLNPWKRLRILCAGVWHNLVLAFVAFLLYISLPQLFSLFYNVGSGVNVSHIHKSSPLLGHKGLNMGDTIIGINDCVVTDDNTWYKCLQKWHMHKPAFCIESDIVNDLDESIPLKHVEHDLVECCDNQKRQNLCFEHLDSKEGVLEVPSYVCLPGRTVVDKSTFFCAEIPHICPSHMFCYKPVLGNITKLFKIILKDNTNVIYLGPVSDLTRTIEVSSYIPKGSLLSSNVPDRFEKLLKYLIMFSLGLAILNILPCVLMDGQHITDTLVYIVFSKSSSRGDARIISTVITWIFTLLLVFHCFYTLWTKIFT